MNKFTPHWYSGYDLLNIPNNEMHTFAKEEVDVFN